MPALRAKKQLRRRRRRLGFVAQWRIARPGELNQLSWQRRETAISAIGDSRSIEGIRHEFGPFEIFWSVRGADGATPFIFVMRRPGERTDSASNYESKTTNHFDTRPLIRFELGREIRILETFDQWTMAKVDIARRFKVRSHTLCNSLRMKKFGKGVSSC